MAILFGVNGVEETVMRVLRISEEAPSGITHRLGTGVERI
jgi:hypothetical protein